MVADAHGCMCAAHEYLAWSAACAAGDPRLWRWRVGGDQCVLQETVRGRGVVGQEPVLSRDQPAFQYSSHVSLQVTYYSHMCTELLIYISALSKSCDKAHRYQLFGTQI